MNGMVQNSWPFVIAAYAVTWSVLALYAVRLWRMNLRTKHPAVPGTPK